MIMDNTLLQDISGLIARSREQLYESINKIMLDTYWLIGQRIVEEEQGGNVRASYGTQMIRELSEVLTKNYGNSFNYRNLLYYRKFYSLFPNWSIVNTRVHNSSENLIITWSHIRLLLRVEDVRAREWYLHEANHEMWSVRTLDRNIATQYYYRLLTTSTPTPKTSLTKNTPSVLTDFIKNPIVTEFLGLGTRQEFAENDVESAILSHLQQFLMELGKGFAFVARQRRIVTEHQDYFIDIVFYNYILKCFVLIDLKAGRITHQDVGQMDMYIRMFDDKERSETDNPTVGIVLCTETDEDIARYSVLHNNAQLFMAKYLLYLPTVETLRHEILQQKALFLSQQQERLSE